ncbi:MAG: hypothetical protein UR69_C0002G0291 [Candidatus Moranbacteria bacterium GW2011_GWE2_35_2-]|nr:MAG: hypothetical protein UR69_C0002G0291 [Candidatus Moranbacteria bacterium GW2011_GWE2_35_2-]KKQ04828.1 MAG: hypothetical protein US15_C0042G0009 [Candidatus Moranbacteria bacterium GW2011_GWF1_36_4]KKQ21889.1 MAG: hypothetical protein US37_C0006G0017 [Candidatus Moranbacteria bacterium GW2011_GWF2_37_11]KKQ29430.1 MAG: hypothetical protein US44_C0001G0022 [Candidatus Moranbacteria bacterium GW2011_GWD1_37_17]KKQ30701.1 MAG: hypothetical protein US47_C0002G0291 [Candidatus Moranbacteria b
MKNKKVIYFFVGLGLTLSLLLASIIFYLQKSNELKVVFLNVGQGDAILISQGSSQVLVDSGKSGKIVLEKLGKYIPFWDRQIEGIVITHPDYDHIAGFVDVLKNYEVKTIVRTGAKSNSKTFEALSEKISKENAQNVEARSGVKMKFSRGAQLEVKYPIFSKDIFSKNTNDESVVVGVDFGESSFLLTGDLPMEKESELISATKNISAKVLKVAHHGSKYSTGDEFLKMVNPSEAIISVGKNNYGHPTPEVVERMERHGIKIMRTDQVGDIAYRCNEKSCVFSSER